MDSFAFLSDGTGYIQAESYLAAGRKLSQFRSDSLIKYFRLTSLSCAVLALLVGLLSLASWYVLSPILVPLRSLPPICYLLLGTSLLFASEFCPKGLRFWGLISSLLLASYAVLQTAVQTGALGASEFLLPLSSLPPIQFLDCVGFVCLALSLAAADVPAIGLFKFSEWICILAFLLAQMALIGLLFGVPSFCILVSCLRVPLVNAVCFAVPCFGVLFCRPSEGCMSLMSSTTSGGAVARQLVPATILLPLLLGEFKVAGQHCHLFDSESGLTLIIILMIVVFPALLLLNAAWLDRADARAKAATEQLAQSERRVRAIVEQASDAFFVLDGQGRVRQWNARCAELFQKKEGDIVGEILWNFLQGVGDIDLSTVLINPSDLGGSHHPRKPIDTVLRTVDGGIEFPAEISAFTVQAQGEHLHCAFVRDITERKAIESRFRDFYFTVSHELRAPLTSIGGSLQLLCEDAETDLSARSSSLIETAQSSCCRLIKLISDLLDVKRIEAGKFTIAPQEVDPLDVITNSLSNVEGIARVRGINIETVVNDATRIKADADRLVQVLTNLLSNAVKFSPENSLIIVQAEITGDQSYRFSVSDEGPGVPDELRGRLFTRFEQLPMRPTFKQVGSGLGLSISKAIVEEHDGRIGISDGALGGATFWFEVPVLDPSASR